jgi:hypothetical protein
MSFLRNIDGKHSLINDKNQALLFKKIAFLHAFPSA